MKICLVSDYLIGFHKNWSGAEMVCKILADSLMEEKQSVLFFTTRFQKKENLNMIKQIPTLSGQPRIFQKLFAPFYILWGGLFSIYYLWRNKPDIINFLHSNYLFIPVMIGARILKVPTVFTFLDYYMICPRATFRRADGKICESMEGNVCLGCISKIKYIERILLRIFKNKLDGVITFTETSKKRLLKYGFEKSKIRIIYTYHIPIEFSSKSREAKDKNILFIGSFHDHKGIRIVIRAMAEVLKEIPEAKLNIIGFGNDFDKREVNKLIDDLGIKSSLNFLGQKNNEEVLDLILDNVSVVVAEQWPSEFGPLVLLESMALGRPVVSGNLGSPPDFIKNGENGFLVDFDKPKQYAEKIIWVLENKEAAEKIGRMAKEEGKILFNHNQGKEHIALYQKLI